MYPHRIRLRGPWMAELLARTPPVPTDEKAFPSSFRVTMPCRWAEAGLVGYRGRVRFRRHFGQPTNVDKSERVWLTFAGVDERAQVTLNGGFLGQHEGPGPFEWEVTSLLKPRNELVVEVEGNEEGGLWGEVALEVRRTAFLRGIRLWSEGDQVHAVGEVVGEVSSDLGEPLELYMVVDRRTVAYATVTASPEGKPFLVSGPWNPADPSQEKDEEKREPGPGFQGKVDLVKGAVVWYTVEQAIPLGLVERPS